jgi:hypothetical protein
MNAYLKTIVGLTLGTLVYELEQLWTSMNFDSFDILATFLALVFIVFIHLQWPLKM